MLSDRVLHELVADRVRDPSARSVRTRPRAAETTDGRRTPIVAVTAHAMAEDRERCLAAGMDDDLPKPLRAGQLFAEIDRVAPAADLPDREAS